MAESHTSTLRGLWKPKLVRVSALGVAAVAAYDSFSSQFGLPKLGSVVGMSGSLLPWWGWLLILQAIFVYALFEYVRRIPQSARAGDNSLPILPELDHVPDEVLVRIGAVDRDLRNLLDALGDRLSAKVEAIKTEMGRGDSRLSTVTVTLSDRIEKLDGKVETIAQLILKNSELQSERNELIGKQIEAARADAKAANDYSVGKGDALQHLFGELRDAQIEAAKEFESFRGLVERALENTWEQLRQRCQFIDQGFAAILDRERLLTLAASIESVGDELSGPTQGEPLGDRDAWLARYGGWHKNVEAWARLGATYRVGVIERVFDTPKNEYRGKWVATDDLFPDSIAVHDYKTFRIILRNFYVEREPVERCVELAAFAHPSTKGRGEIDRDEELLPTPTQPKV